MDLERAFRFSSILLMASGFISLILTGQQPIGLVLVGLAALTLSLLQLSEWGTGWSVFHWSRQTWNTLVVLAFFAFAVDFLWLSQDLLRAGIHFLILLMVNKLFNLHQRRDFLHLYAISLLQLLSAAALTVEIWYAGVFIAYLLAAIWTLLLYNLKNETEEALRRGPVIGAETAAGAINARFFWATNGIAIGAFCLTLAIFFAIPRIGAGFFNKNRAELIRTSGFSEKVDLSAIGAVKLDQTVVMRVEFPDGPRPIGQPLYFRGGAYDFYDGRTWANTLTARRALIREVDGTFRSADLIGSSHLTPNPPPSPGFGGPPQPSVGGSPLTPHASPVRRKPLEGGRLTVLRQEILLEPLDTTALFGISRVESLKGGLMMIQTDMMGNLYMLYPPSTRVQYTVNSALHLIRPEDRQAASLAYPGDVISRFLQLPDLSPRVRDLATRVTRDATTPYDKVAAIEQHLRQNYRYSLDIASDMASLPANPELNPRVNPVEAFLFSRKTGYCEHYATAMVMMLRTQGIPARLLTGFLPGEWNEFGNYYTVRQRDAHAWVEVYFPASGWVTFDPTPAEVAPARGRGLVQFGRMIDSIRLKWDRFVIQYSLRDQMAVAQGIRERGETVRSQLAQWLTAARERIEAGRRWLAGLPLDSATAMVVFIGGAAGVGVLAVLAWRRVRWGGRRGTQSGQEVAVVRLYSRMLRVLRRRGLTKPPSTTPLAFAKHVTRDWADAGKFVGPLTDLYCRVRFGHEPLTADERQLADSLLRELRSQKRQ